MKQYSFFTSFSIFCMILLNISGSGTNQELTKSLDKEKYTEIKRIIPISDSWLVTQVGSQLKIAYGSGIHYPQYGVIHLESGYFRLIPEPSSGWGTSIVLPPSLWTEGTYYQGTPVTVVDIDIGVNLTLTLTGTIDGLNFSIVVIISPPSNKTISAQVSNTIDGTVPLDDRPGEAFKPMMLSSMHISPSVWDSHAVYAGCQIYQFPESGWIIKPAPSIFATSFGLLGGTSTWKTNAPTVDITMEQPMQIAGWKTSSVNPNDDNIGFWAASDVILTSYNYQIFVLSSSAKECLYLPLIQK